LEIDLEQRDSQFGNQPEAIAPWHPAGQSPLCPDYIEDTLIIVKRWQYLALAAAAVAGGIYLYLQSGAALGNVFSSVSGHAGAMVKDGSPWHTIERPGDGFKVDLPGTEKDARAPAYNEAGGSETVHMLTANPASDITYAVTWEDNPPVARVSHSIDRTLYMARDGILARTETTIVNESRGFHRGFPCLDMLARNNGGGTLDARLIAADDRLYVLLAAFPSADARREKDVQRFFKSLVPARPGVIPENVPAAAQE
jgi:hypothetical protein